MTTKITWVDENLSEEEQRIYRDTVTIDPQNPPAALATVAADVEEYDDVTAVEDTTYFYRVSSVTGSGSVEKFSDEVSEASTPVEPDSTGLVALWDFSSLSADRMTINDTSGNGFHAVRTGGGGLIVPAPVCAGFALELNGDLEKKSASHTVDLTLIDGGPGVDITDFIPSVNHPYTMSAWVMPLFATHEDNTGTQNRFFTVFRGKEISSAAGFGFTHGNRFEFFSNGTGGTHRKYTNNGLPWNRYSHICLTYDGTDANLFINGEPAEFLNKFLTPTPITIDPSVNARIGGFGIESNTSNSTTRAGIQRIAEIRWYARELSAHEAKQLYRYGLREIV